MPELSGKTSTKIKKIIRSPKRSGGMALRGYGKAMR